MHFNVWLFQFLVSMWRHQLQPLVEPVKHLILTSLKVFLQILAKPKCQSNMNGYEFWRKKRASLTGYVLTAVSDGHDETHGQNSDSQLYCHKIHTSDACKCDNMPGLNTNKHICWVHQLKCKCVLCMLDRPVPALLPVDNSGPLNTMNV